MKRIKVGINGLGRIGRGFLRSIVEYPQIQVVEINDLAPVETLAHLLKYDSVHGRFPAPVASDQSCLLVNGERIHMHAWSSPKEWAWNNVDIVIEATGRFRSKADAEKHLAAGARKVIISAPSSDEDVKTIVLGVNDQVLDSSDTILSNASCTTNCAAPMVEVIHQLCGIEQAYITTVHSYTGDQRLHDSPHKDLRRARAGALSIIPTTTGAAKAVTKIFPELEGHMGGCGIRVPVPDGSLTDITFVVKKETTTEEVNAAFEHASQGKLKGILDYTTEPLVSVDILGNPFSCIFDSQLTSVLGKMVKVVGWYDNEMGYSNRLKDLVLKLQAMA